MTAMLNGKRFKLKLHPGLEWRTFDIRTSEDIDDFTDIKFASLIVLKFASV